MKEEEGPRISKEMEQKPSCKHRDARLMHHPEMIPLYPRLLWYTKHRKRGLWKDPGLQLTADSWLPLAKWQQQRSTVSIKPLGTMRQGRRRDCNAGDLTHVLPMHAPIHTLVYACGRWPSVPGRGTNFSVNTHTWVVIKEDNDWWKTVEETWIDEHKLYCDLANSAVGASACEDCNLSYVGGMDARERWLPTFK